MLQKIHTKPIATWLTSPIFHKEDHNPTAKGYCLITAALILGFIVSDIYLAQSAKRKSDRWLTVPDPRVTAAIESEDYPYHDSTRLIDKLLGELEATAREKEILRVYYLRVAIRRFVHSDVLSYCYRRLYVSIILGSTGFLLSSISIFFISRQGWKDVNKTWIAVFLISTGSVIFYGGLAVGLNYEDNIRQNESAYTAYSNLEHEFLSYLGTKKSRENEYISPSEFIVYIFLRFEELSRISLDLNSNQISQYQRNINQIFEKDIEEPGR